MAPPKLTPKILLEGTRLTHKTDLAFALNEHPRIVGPRKYRYPSPLISAEWCSFTNRPWGRGLINFEPEERDRAFETYATWARMFELQPYYSWIVDRFHLSTKVWQRTQRGFDPDFGWLEDRLRPLRFCVVLCTRDPRTFLAARADRLRVSGKPEQYDDLSVFEREQEAFREVARSCSLPVLEADMTSGDLDAACLKVADWMEDRDLLGMPA